MLAAVLATSVSLIAFIVINAERKEYTNHKSGIVLITGASQGIGRDAAEYLAKNSNYLVLAGVRKESDYLDIQQANIKNLLPFILDVSSHESCINAVSRLKELIDQYNLPFVGLVNNAGVGSFSPWEFQDINDARTLFDTNVFGLIEITQLTLPLLRVSKGRVIVLSSLSGIVASQFQGLYAASKYAVEAFADSLRREVAHQGISVSIIEPGFVKTAIMRSTLKTSNNGSTESVAPQSAELLGLYPAAAKRDGMVRMLERMPGPSTTTTPAIVHALTSAYPKTRYPVAQASGLSGKTISWMVWLLTDRLKDIIFGK